MHTEQAIEKKYAEEIVFAIYAPVSESEPYNKLLETYTFTLVYSEEGVLLQMKSSHQEKVTKVEAEQVKLVCNHNSVHNM